MPNSFTDIIRLWPTLAEFARDIGIKPSHAGTMLVRGTIPPSHWSRVVAAAAERGLSTVTLDALSSLYEQRSKKQEAA